MSLIFVLIMALAGCDEERYVSTALDECDKYDESTRESNINIEETLLSFEVNISDLDIPPMYFATTIQVSDSINLLMLSGLFPRQSEHLGLGEISHFESIISDFLSASYAPISFFEFNNQHQGTPMSIYYTPAEFFEFDRQTLGSGSHSNVVVIIDADVEDFQFVELNQMPIENEWRNYYFINETLFSIDRLNANQPFVTSWLRLKHQPVRGISFVDSYGDTRVFTIVENFIGGDVPPWRIIELDELNRK